MWLFESASYDEKQEAHCESLNDQFDSSFQVNWPAFGNVKSIWWLPQISRALILKEHIFSSTLHGRRHILHNIA